MFDRESLKQGMPVRSLDGEKLGRVVALGEGAFEVEKGIFFKEDYRITYDEISGVEGNEIILRRNLEELRSPGFGRGESTTQARTATQTWEGEGGELRVPLAEEQLEIHKRERLGGEVRVHKEVVAEQRTIEVPVMHEEARVERVPASTQVPAGAPLRMGEEETVRIPLKEEELEVTKRPVVREELRVTKERMAEAQQVTETIHREQAEVRAAGEEEPSAPRGMPEEPGYKRT